MDKKFLQRKIKELTDDKLIDLLHKTSNESSSVIFELVREEAERRTLKFELTKKAVKDNIDSKPQDKEKLRIWNWGAFLLAPIWTLANKLEMWGILSFIPFVNIVVMFYLGYNGNRLAFEKSNIDSVDDFMIIQKNWGRWGIRVWCFGIVLGLIASILDGVIG